jgi:hypothetical protein
MSTIDINTETGEIKLPMRRVDGIEEIRVRAWIELVTLAGEWGTDTTSGIDYQAIYDGAEDEEIEDDVGTRLKAALPEATSVEVVVTRGQTEDGLNTLEIVATVAALDQVITLNVGTEL